MIAWTSNGKGTEASPSSSTRSWGSRFPCVDSPDWHISPEQAGALGLSSGYATAVEAAYQREEARLAAAAATGEVVTPMAP